MSLRGIIIGGSLLGHGVLVFALGEIRTPAALAATSIEVVETKKPVEPPPPPAKIEPPPPEPTPQKKAERAAPVEAPAPEPAPQPENAPSPSMAALPDLGLELSGGGAGGNGMGIPAQPATPRAASSAPVTKNLAPAAVAKKPVEDTCDEPPAKPKLVTLPQPAYTDAARAAAIEGKVRVEITVDETGKVTNARALTSLGHGLDEAALAAARAAVFEAAVRCGRPSKSTFTLAIRFTAS